MVTLTDDNPNPISQPTKNNILRAMQWLVQGAEPNDSLFLHYSGHGGQTADLDGDEEDGSDEVIYPVDFKQAGHIVDDQMHHILVKPLKAGVRLTAIFDSCHSGSVLDLPYIYSTKGMLKEPNLAKEAGAGLLGALTSYARGDIAGVATSIFNLGRKAMSGNDAYEKAKETRTSPADVIMWSGSKDSQTSSVFLPTHKSRDVEARSLDMVGFGSKQVNDLLTVHFLTVPTQPSTPRQLAQCPTPSRRLSARTRSKATLSC
jgi:hypothetical protein